MTDCFPFAVLGSNLNETELEVDRVKFLSVGLLMLLSTHAFAQGQFKTGNELKQQCFSKNNMDEMFCMGYIIGVADSNALSICSPVGRATQGQFVDIAKKYLNDNPAQLHRDADSLVLVALKQSFPCPKK